MASTPPRPSRNPGRGGLPWSNLPDRFPSLASHSLVEDLLQSALGFIPTPHQQTSPGQNLHGMVVGFRVLNDLPRLTTCREQAIADAQAVIESVSNREEAYKWSGSTPYHAKANPVACAPPRPYPSKGAALPEV